MSPTIKIYTNPYHGDWLTRVVGEQPLPLANLGDRGLANALSGIKSSWVRRALVLNAVGTNMNSLVVDSQPGPNGAPPIGKPVEKDLAAAVTRFLACLAEIRPFVMDDPATTLNDMLLAAHRRTEDGRYHAMATLAGAAEENGLFRWESAYNASWAQTQLGSGPLKDLIPALLVPNSAQQEAGRMPTVDDVLDQLSRCEDVRQVKLALALGLAQRFQAALDIPGSYQKGKPKGFVGPLRSQMVENLEARF